MNENTVTIPLEEYKRLVAVEAIAGIKAEYEALIKELNDRNDEAKGEARKAWLCVSEKNEEIAELKKRLAEKEEKE